MRLNSLWSLGNSVQGRSLDALAIAPQGASSEVSSKAAVSEWPWILCLGGVHGDEIEGVWLLDEMRAVWTKEFPYSNVGVILWNQVNPDGVALRQRWNANNIDLNRNLPSKDWTSEIKNPRYPPGSAPCSEPENKALVRLIETCKPQAIVSVHSFSDYQVNANGPAKQWAESLGKVCGYKVTEDIGYPTPGSLGTFAGVEKQIPTITLEVERGIAREKVLSIHIPVMEAALDYWDKKGAKK